MKRLCLIACSALFLWAAAAAPASARVRVVNVSLSPQILLELYRSHQNHLSSIGWVNPSIFLIAVNADAASAGQYLAFDVEIFDGATLVARAGHFRVLARTLVRGPNSFNANDISAEGLTIEFNDAYSPGNNPGQIAQGNLMPMGNYKVLIRPVDPTPGDPYILGLSLFTPQSALNLPPLPIFPKGVAVNTLLPTFAWTPVAKAAWYVLTVGPDQNTEVNTYWKSGRLNGTQALYSPAARILEDGKKYFWQVRAYDTFGRPIGGVNGQSQPAAFTINSSARLNTAVSPAEVEVVLKNAIPDPSLFTPLNNFQPVAVETDCEDLADLLRQLRDGSAKVISARVE